LIRNEKKSKAQLEKMANIEEPEDMKKARQAKVQARIAQIRER
jgi:hypothetical protein